MKDRSGEVCPACNRFENRRNIAIYPPRRRFIPRPAEPENRLNEKIRVPEVRLIDDEGNQVGVVPTPDALKMAQEKGLDLVEIAPQAQPPVCKVMDYGKYLFQQKKKAGEAKKKQKVIVVKEVQFRPRIDDHDFEFKKNHAIRFLEHGDKVKAIIRFRGREMAHQALGRAVLDRLIEEVKEYGTVDGHPEMQGNRMMIVLSPHKH